MTQTGLGDLKPHGEAGYRPLPYNEQAEQSLLGALLVKNDILDDIERILQPESFFIPVHRRIYEAIRHVVDKGQIATPITLGVFFAEDEALSGVGGTGYLAKLAASAAMIINADDFARQIQEHHLRRQLVDIGETMVSDAYEFTIDHDAMAQIEEAEKSLFDLAEHGAVKRAFRSFRDVTVPTLEMMEATFRDSSGLAGQSTGLKNLDDQIGGLSRTDLLVLAARPGMGKTSLATTLALQVAGRNLEEAGSSDGPPGRVGIFSLEMSAEQLVARMLAEETGIPSQLIRNGLIKQSDFEDLVTTAHRLSALPLHIDDTPAISIAQLRGRARRLKRQSGGLSLLIVDYLQLVVSAHRSGGERNRVQEVSEITQGLKALAKELDVPVIACSQLSRAVEQREDKRPLLSDLRESGSIEQDADIVMFLFRPEYYHERRKPQPKDDEDEDDPGYRRRLERWEGEMETLRGVSEIIVAKNRHGPTGEAKLHFDSSTTRFMDLESRYASHDGPY